MDKGCSPFFLTCQMNLGELGEIFGILFFYLYPGKEVESFITTHYRHYATCLFPYVVFSLVKCSSTRAKVKKTRKWLVRCQNGFEFIVVVLDVRQKIRKAWRKLWKDTFLVWTQPSLSASVSPSAVSAAKPRILWCSCCFGHPSCHSAMSAINNCPQNDKCADVDLIREKWGLQLYLMVMKSMLCIPFFGY